MNADQFPIGLEEDELQESAAAGDGAARCEAKVGTAHLVIEALFAALLLGEAGTGHLWHPVDRGDVTRIDRALERDPERVTDRDSPLLHRDRGQRWTNHVARGVDTWRRGAEVLVDNDPPPGIELYV